MTADSVAAASLDTLAAYAVDTRTGFVPTTDPLEQLPAAFAAWEELVPELSALIRSRCLRRALLQLETLDPRLLQNERERERGLLLLSVFANGWVWGGAEPNFEIPPQIAVPLCAVAGALDRPPLVHYASMALHNWKRIDRNAPLSIDNARMQVQFLGGVDEDWFFIGSLGVELAGAPLLASAHAATIASHREDDHALAEPVGRIAECMAPVLHALARLRDWCDPYIFYHRVRPFLAGWPAPGAVYQGVSPAPCRYVGGSAGQSSLIQSIDALLGIQQGESAAGRYLRDVRRYMPVEHRRFVEDIERTSCVRARALRGAPALHAAYNDAVAQVDLFRRQHLDLARDYIAKPSGFARDERGTGGTAFVEFLREAQEQTDSMKLPRR